MSRKRFLIVFEIEVEDNDDFGDPADDDKAMILEWLEGAAERWDEYGGAVVELIAVKEMPISD